MHIIFFPYKYGTRSQQKATASLQKAFNLTRHSRRSMLLTVREMCSSFYIARAMVGRKETNDSLEKKKKSLLGFGGKTIFFFPLSLFCLFSL